MIQVALDRFLNGYVLKTYVPLSSRLFSPFEDVWLGRTSLNTCSSEFRCLFCIHFSFKYVESSIRGFLVLFPFFFSSFIYLNYEIPLGHITRVTEKNRVITVVITLFCFLQECHKSSIFIINSGLVILTSPIGA